ncbi:MAG: hypothetical protein EAX87_04405 [Candidatus Thorarchaeota archaeon]|nr:hypothetical protein [Candidatus Thorarchaeota archaeon]
MSGEETQGYSELASESEDEEMKSHELELTEVSLHSDMAKRAALAAIMAALSLASSPIASVVPRVPGWDIALFDPVSFFWIIAFLIGGIFVGLVATFAGTVGLFFFDPSGIGPIFKLLATAPMIIVPWLAVYATARKAGGKKLASPSFYIATMIVAFLLRLLIMVPVNLVMVPILYGNIYPAEFIATYAVILNTSQSIWDALVPFLIVYPTGIFRHFKMW